MPNGKGIGSLRLIFRDPGPNQLLTPFPRRVDQILARTSASGATAWYLTDHEGSVRDVVGTSGTVLDHVAYDSYGNVTSESSPSNGDRFKFDGMAMDAAVGLYYDNARWYDANAGRFIGQDPSGFRAGDSDLYRFVGDGPTDKIDPTGLDDLDPLVANPIVWCGKKPSDLQGFIRRPVISNALTQAWNDSNFGKPGTTEQGGWIYWNPNSGNFTTRPAPRPTVPNPENGNPPTQYTPLGNPPDLSNDGYMVIGDYHTYSFPNSGTSPSDFTSLVGGVNLPSFIVASPTRILYIPPGAGYPPITLRP